MLLELSQGLFINTDDIQIVEETGESEKYVSWVRSKIMPPTEHGLTILKLDPKSVYVKLRAFDAYLLLLDDDAKILKAWLDGVRK